MKTIGDRLRNARERKNLKQIQVMEITGGRINNKTLSGYEKGVSEPDFETLKILASLYEVSVDYLLGHNTTNDQARYAALEEYNRLPQSKKKLVDDMIKALLNED